MLVSQHSHREESTDLCFLDVLQLPQWLPLSVVKGGTSANLLVKSMNGSFAQNTFRDTLVRNIGTVLYKDRIEIEKSLKTSFPMMKNATEFEYGFKIRVGFNPRFPHFFGPDVCRSRGYRGKDAGVEGEGVRS